MAIYSEFSHQKWWFSIATLNYQRVNLTKSRRVIKKTAPVVHAQFHAPGLYDSWSLPVEPRLTQTCSGNITTYLYWKYGTPFHSRVQLVIFGIYHNLPHFNRYNPGVFSSAPSSHFIPFPLHELYHELYHVQQFPTEPTFLVDTFIDVDRDSTDLTRLGTKVLL